MPNKRPNFQRIIPTNDPPKVIDLSKKDESENSAEVPKEEYFQKRTVRFDLKEAFSVADEPFLRPKTAEDDKPYYEPSLRFANPPKEPEEEKLIKEDDGYYSLRKNYQRVKPSSKYTQEGLRPVSPNIPYSYLSEDLTKRNAQNSGTFFEPTLILDNKSQRTRYYKERPTDCFSEHLIRGLSAPQPYCFIAKEAKNNYVPAEYTNSRYGAYPPWGIEETGFRTRSHYISEPANRFGNIDMYKRPLTNQPGKIIFDHGRPNNGYYLQRHQYDNTWWSSKIKLNQQDILRDINSKSKDDYDYLEEMNKGMVRAKSVIWPHNSEYVEKFILKNNT